MHAPRRAVVPVIEFEIISQGVSLLQRVYMQISRLGSLVL